MDKSIAYFKTLLDNKSASTYRKTVYQIIADKIYACKYLKILKIDK